MEVLTDIPFVIDFISLQKQARLSPESEESNELLGLAEIAKRAGNPKAVYTVSFIEKRDGEALEIDGVWFESRTLSNNLAKVERVFPFIATCGHEMDEAAPRSGDLLTGYWWELVKTQLLVAAGKYLSDHVHSRYLLNKTAIMRPGSGDAAIWPIEQQQNLFRLLGDVQQTIGVRLTDSHLMIPNKTSSGIMFPTETSFRSCEVCHRDNCPSRQTAFSPQAWRDLT